MTVNVCCGKKQNLKSKKSLVMMITIGLRPYVETLEIANGITT